MMLQIQHRVSYDIDIFLPDPQVLGFLDPDRNSFNFDTKPTAYPGDGARFQRFVFKNLGEIDFIAAPPLTDAPSIETVVENQLVKLETIPEIIAKKIHFRGKSIQTRDLFDIAAAAHTHPSEVRGALKGFPADVRFALAAAAALKSDFVWGAIEELQIMPAFLELSKETLAASTKFLRNVLDEG
jgi:hypothetical protein